jgi:citrate synthase
MTPTTSLCHATADDILLRGRSLPHAILGHTSFTEVLYRQLTGRDATAGQAAVLDACLVALMEHGLTPSVVSARLTYGSAPEAIQGAVAAGLLGVGSVFVGASEACAALLERIAAARDPAAEAGAIARASARVPGFGHPLHRSGDPRAARLLAIAREHQVAGAHVAALEELAAAVAAAAGRPIVINATGAVAALLLDAGLPAAILRGIALISRCAGLVAHIREEQVSPAMPALWHGAEAAVPYAGPPVDPEP